MGRIKPELLGVDEKTAMDPRNKAYIKDETTGKCYIIPFGFWSVGRKDDIDVDLPVETQDEYMSRKHANIILRKNIIGENALYICDTVARKNPTEVDGYRIGHHYNFQLFDGSTVLMGYTRFTVHLFQ